MTYVAGVFDSVDGARCAVDGLREFGIPDARINLLAPGTTQAELESRVEASSSEQPGMGGAMGGTVGAAFGAAGGMELGALVATVLVPGIGPVLAAGLVGAALLGAGGAVAGTLAGKALEENIEGVPHDELFVYEDALRRGRSVVFVVDLEEEVVESVDRILKRCGAESIDAAREEWWVGLRDAEREYYEAEGKSFSEAESDYRKGFEASLHTHARGKTYEKDFDRLNERFGEICRSDAFKSGYGRGREYESTMKRG